MSFPSSTQIAAIFQNLESQHADFLANLDDNIKLTIFGQDHEFSGEINGKEDLLAKHVKPILGLLDTDGSPVVFEVVRVVGGGDSPWAAVELKSTSTSKAGKPWVHEHAYFAHFTAGGKIDQLRGYYDSAHLNAHVADSKSS